MQKFILLDIDGVMVPASGWKPVAIHADGFYQFSQIAQRSLEWLLGETKATIILTTTHRTRYSSIEWKELLSRRFQAVNEVLTLDDSCNQPVPLRFSRLDDVVKWVHIHGNASYVILEDDSSLNGLPDNIITHWVKTFPNIGLNAEAAEKALEILHAAV